ncbi:hypothetical protein PsYK624_162920 [Phanerochaete sordida]|uniref:Uncharacterized protein n=1 Tax=Phanerochaete sordida TaxID=48140 RepID=A0A9P3LMU0_9APHY|nr:hypothetical protein PsYK624_162920 [Phanerochaete sordida]
MKPGCEGTGRSCSLAGETLVLHERCATYSMRPAEAREHPFVESACPRTSRVRFVSLPCACTLSVSQAFGSLALKPVPIRRQLPRSVSRTRLLWRRVPAYRSHLFRSRCLVHDGLVRKHGPMTYGCTTASHGAGEASTPPGVPLNRREENCSSANLYTMQHFTSAANSVDACLLRFQVRLAVSSSLCHESSRSPLP